MTAPATIAGVDGCRTGWFVALANVGKRGPTDVRCTIEPTIQHVAAALGPGAIIAIDMPIGLLREPRKGGRDADAALRRVLGPRRSSVFSPPPRGILQCAEYHQALAACRATGDGTALSKQAWNITPRIREVDAFVRAALAHADAPRLFEVHPEMCWAVMRSGDPLAPRPARHAKRTAEGHAERLALLAAHGLPPSADAMNLVRPGTASRDDALDAHAALWTAWRLARGTAHCTPSVPPLDACGLPMAVWT